MNPASALSLAYWLPLLCVIPHLVEEFIWPGGFMAWDRGYRPQFSASITPRALWSINSLLVAAAILCAAMGESSRRGASLCLVLMAILGGNALFHLRAVLRTRRYSPGVVTGALLYLPACAYAYMMFFVQNGASPGLLLQSALIGAAYPWISEALHRRRAQAGKPSRQRATPNV
jgi:hypothetical protein